MATHSIKITIVKKWGRHHVGAVLPERFGAYPGDTVVWNVEAAGDIGEATVRVGDFGQIEPEQMPGRYPFKADPGQNSATVADHQRREISATLVDAKTAEDGRCYGRYRYTIFINDQHALDPEGDFCPFPPCPPPF